MHDRVGSMYVVRPVGVCMVIIWECVRVWRVCLCVASTICVLRALKIYKCVCSVLYNVTDIVFCACKQLQPVLLRPPKGMSGSQGTRVHRRVCLWGKWANMNETIHFWFYAHYLCDITCRYAFNMGSVATIGDVLYRRYFPRV